MSPSSGLWVQITCERARKEGNSSHSWPSAPSSSGSSHRRKENSQRWDQGARTQTKAKLFLSWQLQSCRDCGAGPWLVCACVLSCGKHGSFSFKLAAAPSSHKAMPPQLPTRH